MHEIRLQLGLRPDPAGGAHSSPPDSLAGFKGSTSNGKGGEGRGRSKCTKFDQLILRKIIKIAATRCHIIRLKCTKFDFGWGCTPDPAGISQRSPRPLAGLRGPTSKGKGGKWKGRGLSKCTKFDQLILRKIIKIAATRRQIIRLKCTKIDFGWGCAPDPAGSSQCSPDP